MWQGVSFVKFSGDKHVWNNVSSATVVRAGNADLGRVRKAWGLLFSKACTGAKPSEI